MDIELRNDADRIIKSSIDSVLPNEAVRASLQHFKRSSGKLVMIAVGKAAWTMASAALATIGNVDEGVLITKDDHALGALNRIVCYEAGHPIPDQRSFQATRHAISLVENLTEKDTVLFLLSGGGSALFEDPLIDIAELQKLTNDLLARGANIVEINSVRKRLSRVKGGKFAQLCAPAKVYSIILSDILENPVDMIASGPTVQDTSTSDQTIEIIQKYNLELSDAALTFIHQETPKKLKNVEYQVIGSVRDLVIAAKSYCESLGYHGIILSEKLTCEASDAGRTIAETIHSHKNCGESLAFIAGGETVVHLRGNGKGGRNQEIALAAAEGIAGIKGAAVFSIGSDGTDGPTEAAGGFVDSDSYNALIKNGIDPHQALENNDSYHALKSIGGLIITGPTGTNVNDLSVGLMKV